MARRSSATEVEEVEDNLDEFDYEKDLAIDLDFLEFEWQNHPVLFMKYAKESSNAQKEMRLADERVKTTRSRLIKEAKESGEKYTETTLEAYYRDNLEYKKVKNAWIEAEYYANLMQNVVFAFQARKSALENHVKLQGQQYFAGPEVPHDLPEAREKFNQMKSKGVQNRIKETMKGGRNER